MKVFLVKEPNVAEIVEMERPVPGPDQVLAKVLHCGICATDVSIVDGTLNLGEGNSPVYPVRIGHEWSGRVVETGSAVKRFKAGDRMISETGYSCGVCEYCLRGEINNCAEGRAVGTIGNHWPGAFAEYMLMPERLSFHIPGNVPSDTAALVEPASVGFYGLTRTPIGPGTTLLVIGTGPISLGGMACAKGVGSGKIILAGRKEAKLAIGKKLGADVIVNMEKEDLREAVMRETNGRGADVVMDSTGAPGLLNLSVSLTRSSGCIVLPGFYEQPVNNFALDNIIVRNCVLIGGAGAPDMQRRILDLLERGHIDLKPMITDRYPFEKIKEAFAAVGEKNDTRIKIMVDF
ncbi:MAG: alcohol dehydrogenase catalytic domain-containing protein [Treponema sp.]|jgi:threonine dehydrogenase-like Zn-dependent dehydrogenase|nr:alcohol dehydrogenase catalytic domain-containing protein [Treponema sp.]